MKKVERCEYGHIRAQKNSNLRGALLMIAVGVAIFIAGLCLNKFESRNIFTVFAVLFVLPMARYLCTWFVMLPYHTPESELYDRVKAVVPEGSILLSDYLFTSGERAMGMSFVVLTGHKVIGLAARDKEKTEKITEYLSQELKKRGIPGKVIVYKEEERFLSEVKNADTATRTEEEWTELTDFLRSLAV
ncbi:MAG: hypothetical protein IJZ55_10000 [Lachnospiraceae bacterium]|nr:hypothetical protein [Lachnospiraceae bacterium]